MGKVRIPMATDFRQGSGALIVVCLVRGKAGVDLMLEALELLQPFFFVKKKKKSIR